VLSVCEGEDEMYEIIPSYGESYIVNSKHILSLMGNIPKICFKKSHTFSIRLHEYTQKRRTRKRDS
ncbi:MAG: hypothetical protein AABY22_32545, partial [Nanoarchaeota archaeon]